MKTVLSTINFSCTNSTYCTQLKDICIFCSRNHAPLGGYTNFLQNMRKKWKMLERNRRNFLWSFFRLKKILHSLSVRIKLQVTPTQWFDLWICLSFFVVLESPAQKNTNCNRKIHNAVENLCSKNAQRIWLIIKLLLLLLLLLQLYVCFELGNRHNYWLTGHIALNFRVWNIYCLRLRYKWPIKVHHYTIHSSLQTA